jgi:hypothetical protein
MNKESIVNVIDAANVEAITLVSNLEHAGVLDVVDPFMFRILCYLECYSSITYSSYVGY